MAFGINSNRGEGEGKPEQTTGGGWDTAERRMHGEARAFHLTYLLSARGLGMHQTAPVSARASCLHRGNSMGAPRPENCHRNHFGEHRDLIPQAGSSHSAKKKTFQGS